MKKNIYYSMVVLLASLSLGACSTDDSPSTFTFESSEKPTWSIDLSGNDTAPGWQDIKQTQYENWMYVTVKLQDELAAYATTDDRMVVFIGDEQRTKPAVPNIYTDGSVYFVLAIGGNSTDHDINIRLCYWCSKLRQLFTIEEKSVFTPQLPYGNTTDYVPPLLKGGKKYPVVNSLTVNVSANAPFTTASGDRVAVFVGEVCRGVGTVGQPFSVYRTSVGESVQLRYYSTEKSGIYLFQKTVSFAENEKKTMTIDF